ncbi:IS1182 family transposase [Lentisalinibacter sediminis]|uniref:IS1182 family transposase n=1 Tax=Lentisalinibacter sediminis TaxID=2992237 RepID=UPI00386B95D2
MSYVRGESRTQGTLFPTSLDELVGDDHVCRVIEAFVEGLELGEMGFSRACPSATGRPPYDPADLLKLYIYGYLHQTRSSRRLERECARNVEVMWLLNRLAPDHKTIARFRQHNGEALRRTCALFVQLCRRAGLVSGEWVAIDGSKFQAVASRKAVWSEERLAREQARLEAQIGDYLERLDAVDDSEGEETGDARAIRAALELLRAEQAEQARVQASLDEKGGRSLTATETDARPMRGTGPGYNVQSAVDAGHHLIVFHAVTDEATDNRSLRPLAEGAQRALGSESMQVLADAGYANGEQAAALEERGITPYVASNRAVNNQGNGKLFPARAFRYEEASDTLECPAGKRLHRKQLQRRNHQIIYSAREEDCAACALKAQCTDRKRRLVGRHVYEQALSGMAERTTPSHMRRRASIVEHPFGTLKYQIFEKPRFLMRGLSGAGTEMALAVLAYNLKRAMKVLGNTELRQRLITAAAA